MRLRRTFFLGLVCCIVICSAADEEYEDYEEPAPSPKPVVPSRHSPLLNRRNPLIKGKTSTTTTTTTTPAAPAKAEENEETNDKIAEEEEVSADSSSTTEPPKKLGAGILRPFRSNDDLLASLKRRREQQSIQKSNVKAASESEVTETQSAPVETAQKPRHSAPKRRFNSIKSEGASTETQEHPAVPSKPTRRFSSRTN